MMHAREKSDPAIVAGKPAKAADAAAAEPAEPRAGAEGNAGQADTHRTPGRASVSPGLERVRTTARLRKEERFTALLHHVDVALLRFAYEALKRDAAAGVDGVTWRAYGGEGLEQRLRDLKDRIHRGAFRALPSRRVFIAKADGRQRPLGIASLEDKIVQRAVVEVLNAIWEEDFLGFSYGFRPGRGPHDALDALYVGITRRPVNYVLDADIAGFFDTVRHDWLIRFVERRVGDPRLLRLIRKWLKAGVMEDGVVRVGETGTPQGAVISPLLANIYLHDAFDLWAHRWRSREAHGAVILVRYADDIVAGFEHRAEAERFLASLRGRLAAFGLTLHPDKTRLVAFGRNAARDRRRRGLGKPETFDFLGFTHLCGVTRKGRFSLHRKTRRDRLRAKLRQVKETLRRRLHEPIEQQGAWLRQVVGGFFAYHAVPNNIQALGAFRRHVGWLWGRSLRRRSQKDATRWRAVTALVDHWLPKPHIIHPWPDRRFAATHPRWEPGAGNPHAGFCAGGAP